MNLFRNFRYDRIIPNGTASYKIGVTNELNKLRSPSIKRSYMGETYEGTGKTTGHIVNKRNVQCLCIEAITAKGFKLTNGWNVVGPTIFFPYALFSWNIKDLNDISTDSLTLFSVLNPKIDTLFLGVGNKENLSFDKIKDIRNICKRMDISFEILSTENAAATFNFCSLDRRFVSAALIPPAKIIYNRDLTLFGRSHLPDVNA